MYGDKGLSLKKRQPFCLTRNKFTTKTSRGCKRVDYEQSLFFL